MRSRPTTSERHRGTLAGALRRRPCPISGSNGLEVDRLQGVAMPLLYDVQRDIASLREATTCSVPTFERA